MERRGQSMIETSMSRPKQSSRVFAMRQRRAGGKAPTIDLHGGSGCKGNIPSTPRTLSRHRRSQTTAYSSMKTGASLFSHESGASGCCATQNASASTERSEARLSHTSGCSHSTSFVRTCRLSQSSTHFAETNDLPHTRKCWMKFNDTQRDWT